MIEVRIYQVMSQVAVEVHLSQHDGQTVEAACWYGDLDESDPVEGLVDVIRNAFRSVDGYAGEISDRSAM